MPLPNPFSRMKLPVLLFLPLLVHAGSPLQTAASKNPKAPIEAIEPPPATLGWTLGAGILWRQLGELEVRGGHHARISDLPSLRSRAHSTGGGGRGGNYRDGYVLPDSTGGLQTWNWGYDSAAQVSGNNLSFNSFSSVITHEVSALHQAHGWSDDLEGAGAFISIQTPDLRKWKNLSLSLSGSYSYVQDESSYEAEVFRAVQRAHEQSSGGIDVYDISAVAPLPGAPYSGTFEGPGPVISLSPISSSGGGAGSGAKRLIEEEPYISHVEQSVEVRLHTLSLGPKIAMEQGQLSAIAGFGIAVNLADWEGQSEETLSQVGSGRVIKGWRDRASDTEVLLGAYAELGAQWQISARWSVNASARYDWSQDLAGSLGPSQFALNLAGFTATLGIGWTF
jgi:hypothetical protein